MNDFENLSISSAIEGLANKNFTSLELTEFFIKKIEKNKDLNVLLHPLLIKQLKWQKFQTKKSKKTKQDH